MTRARAMRAHVTDWIERAAVGASFLCLVHCVGLPLLLAALPALSTLIAVPESFHVWVLAFAVPSSGLALTFGWRMHRNAVPIGVGVAGLALLAVAALVLIGTRFETPVTVAGSLCLAFAHLANWRWRHREHRHG